MTLEGCIAILKRFKYTAQIKSDDDVAGTWLVLRDPQNKPDGFGYPKDTPPERLAQYMKDFLSERGIDLD